MRYTIDWDRLQREQRAANERFKERFAALEREMDESLFGGTPKTFSRHKVWVVPGLPEGKVYLVNADALDKASAAEVERIRAKERDYAHFHYSTSPTPAVTSRPFAPIRYAFDSPLYDRNRFLVRADERTAFRERMEHDA